MTESSLVPKSKIKYDCAMSVCIAARSGKSQARRENRAISCLIICWKSSNGVGLRSQEWMSVNGSSRTIVLRRITTFVVLTAFAGIYAVPLAAAIFPTVISDCCANGMCPRQRTEAKSQTSGEAVPDCPMHNQKSAPMSCCRACACSTSHDTAIGIGYYVLPAPTRVVFALSVSPFAGLASQFARNITSVPDAPPPRS